MYRLFGLPRRHFMLHLFACIFTSVISLSVSGQKRNFYELKIYHLNDQSQLERVNSYLKNSFIPAVHRAGIKPVGVFSTLETDTSGIRLYVLFPFSSLEALTQLQHAILKDKNYQTAGSDYINASYDNVPYARIETIILEAFPGAPTLEKPELAAPNSERIYELRSYEGPTEKYHASKLKMFNEGSEINIFKRLGFNRVFYAEVLSGSHMPNLMYMTTFNSMADRNAHWKAFGQDAEWKKLSSLTENQHNVSKADITFLHPTDYSDL